MLSKSAQLQSLLADLRQSPGVEGAAVVSRDGISVVDDATPSDHRDTFAAMAAAMLGAAETAMVVTGKGLPERVLVESGAARFVVCGITDELLLVLFLAPKPVSIEVDALVKSAQRRVRAAVA